MRFWAAGAAAVAWTAGLGLPSFLHAADTAAAATIRADWVRQEAMFNRTAGSAAAIRACIVRGRELAAEMKKVGKNQAAERCLQQLAEAEAALNIPSATGVDPLTQEDGWHLFRAAICGAGEPLDNGRVQGKDYTFSAAPAWKATGPASLLPTVSWDATAVVYRFTGLDPAARYRLRAIYGVDQARTLCTAAGGRLLHEVQVPDYAAVEQTSDIPAAAIQDHALELRITRVAGSNAVVSALELWSSVTETDPAARQRLAACRAKTAPVPVNCESYFQVRRAVRELLFTHPALDFDELLFVRRHWPHMNHQCGHRVGENQTPGADLCVLKGLRPDGQVRGLLPPELAAKCGIGRPDLSFDATHIVFPLALPRDPPTRYPSGGGHAGYDPKNPADSSSYRGGACQMYDIYEINANGSGLRQITRDTKAENTEPCYLPDGRIVFTSSRGGRMVQCGDWALVFGMYTMNPDGSDVRSFTQPQDSEFYPSMLDDGRILFTRWDYVMKAYNVIQQLWSVYPDGTRTQLAYGDWQAFSRGPIALFEARQIPGTQQVVAVGAAHHNTCAGPLMIADLEQNRGGPGGLRNITPEVGYPECQHLLDERTDSSVPDSPRIGVGHGPAGWYASPWPLAENLFLCSSNYEAGNNTDAYGIYLVDAYGNRELVFRAAGTSCYAPMPLKPRRVPLKISPQPPPPQPNTPGRLFVQNVQTGLDGVAPGTVKWLRVCETYPKLRHTNPHRVDVGVGSGWDMRGVLGFVPVEEDGSASFEIPSGKMIFLEALDRNFLEVRRMRNYINLQPGEQQSCIGCHEKPGTASPPAGRPLAARRAPSVITPPPWGAGPMRFAQVVQPVLDRNCIRCHGNGKAKLDLRGGCMVTAPHAGDKDEGSQHTVSTSFLALLQQVRYVRVNAYGGEKLPLKPYAYGSAASPLMQMLQKGHHEVKLAATDWGALAAWIDCNAPYYGSYDDDFLARTPAAPAQAGEGR